MQILERWREGHSQADVSVVVATGVAPDDAAAQLVSQLAAFIKKRARPVTTPARPLSLASQLPGLGMGMAEAAEAAKP